MGRTAGTGRIAAWPPLSQKPFLAVVSKTYCRPACARRQKRNGAPMPRRSGARMSGGGGVGGVGGAGILGAAGTTGTAGTAGTTGTTGTGRIAAWPPLSKARLLGGVGAICGFGGGFQSAKKRPRGAGALFGWGGAGFRPSGGGGPRRPRRGRAAPGRWARGETPRRPRWWPGRWGRRGFRFRR